MRIQNNITASNSHRQLGINSHNISSNTEKLSSGFRVNRAADDAAGLAVSEKMRTQVRGLNRASLNIQDGVSLLQVGDSALQAIHDKMQRLRELSVQSANDTNQALDREALQLEFGQLSEEINQVVNTTNFNGRMLFDGSVGAPREYHLGNISAPYIATISADNDFDAGGVNVPGWTLPSFFGVQTTVFGLSDADIPTSGVFAMQIVTPADGTFSVVIDFAAVNNPAGSLTVQGFLDYFRTEFNTLAGGPFIQNIFIDNDEMRFTFPTDSNGNVTGIMARVPNAPIPDPFPDASRPRVHIGLGNNQSEAVDSLNGISSANFPGPFKSNRPMPPHGPALVGGPGGDFFTTHPVTGLPTPTNMMILGNNQTGVPGVGNRASVPTGGFANMEITVNGRSTPIYFIPGNYPNAQSFVDANKHLFTAQDFELNIDPNNPNKILITSRIQTDGTAPVVNYSINPLTIAEDLGFNISFLVDVSPAEADSLPIQSGANEGDVTHIEIPRLCTRSLGLSMRRPTDETANHFNSLGANGYTQRANIAGDPMEYSLDVTSHEKASAALEVLSNAINIISMERAALGAQQNRLEFAMSNVDNTAENLQAAESRIRDVDMAAEMTTLVQNQILQQSSTAMLAQANALPQGVLQLLG